MMDFWMQNTKKELKMYSDRRNIPAIEELVVGESHGVVRIAAGNSEIVVTAYAHYAYG